MNYDDIKYFSIAEGPQNSRNPMKIRNRKSSSKGAEWKLKKYVHNKCCVDKPVEYGFHRIQDSTIKSA